MAKNILKGADSIDVTAVRKPGDLTITNRLLEEATSEIE